MNTLHLTDQEFRHYHGLYNPDPVVQRLCAMPYADEVDPDLESQVSDLEDQVSDLEYTNMNLVDERDALEERVEVLEAKIKMWQTLESE